MRPSRGRFRFPARRRPVHWRAWGWGAVLVAAAAALGVAAGGNPKRTALQRGIDAILTDPALKGARIGCRVLEGDTGRVLYSFHATEPLVPASNMKLATTAAALELLGPDYRLVTRLGLVGKDLVVIGAGDPNISGRFFGGRITAVFEAWAEQLKAREITVVEGDLVGDDTLFDRQYCHPTWPAEQLSYWYCAPVGALSLNDNCADVWVRPGEKVGRPAVVGLAPPGDHLAVVNRAVTVGGKERSGLDVRRLGSRAAVVISGRVPLGAAPVRRYVAVHDPGMFFLESLEEVLSQRGIRVTGTCRLAEGPTDAKAFKPLAECTSTLASAVEVANTRSQNFYAESLLKLVGARAGGAPGTFAKGAAAVEAFLARAGVGRANYVSADGSGLSRRNRLSALALTTLLRYMAGRPTGTVYRRSLATSGVDGGLRRRMAEEPFRGRVHAKTGTLTGVSALSGYLDTLDGRTLVFSILINSHRCSAAKARAIQDDVCRTLVRSQPSEER